MAISGKRILLQNNQALRAKDQNGDVQDLLKLDSSGEIAGKVKEYIDAQDQIDQGEITELQQQMATKASQADLDAEETARAQGDQAARDYADQKIADLVGSAPELLNTLEELASAIDENPNFASAIAQQIGEKASQAALDIVEGRVDTAESDIDALEQSVALKASQSDLDALDGRVEQAESDIGSLEGRMGSAETAIQNLASSTAIVELDGRIDQLEADMPTKAAQVDLDALEGRVDSAESAIALKASQSALDSEISRAQGAEEALDGRLDIVEPKVSALEGEMDAVEGRASALEGRMDSAESSIALKASQADLDSVEGRVDTAEADIDALEGRMGLAESAISNLASSTAIVELDGRVDVLEAAMPLKASQSALEQEVQDREDADAALGVRIDNILSNTTPGSLDSLVEVVQAFEQADQNLNNAITSLASSASSALQSEVTRATQAEQALSDAIALKAAKTYVDAQDQAILAASKDYADELAAGMTYQREFHVNFDFTGTSDGSPVKPFKTIQAAVDAAISDNSGANNHIMVHNKGNTVISENIVINNANQNLFIEGMAHVKDGYAVRIDGSISIQGSSTRVRLKGLQVMSPDASTPALSVVGTPGRHIFEKCAFEVGGVSFSGSYANWASFEDCSFEGPVSFAGSPAANTLITMYRSFAGSADVVVNSANVIVSIMDTYSMKSITHSAGTVAVDNLRSIGSAGIVSTASAGLLSLTRVSMQQPDLSFAPINKSGAAYYQLISVHRGETADTLSGTRVAYGPTATDQGYKMGVSGNWASAVYAVGPALDSLAANKASSASVTSGLAGKASTTLNNLGVTSINADLLPSATSTRSFGSSLLYWMVGWFATVRTATIQAVVNALTINTPDSSVAATGPISIKTGNGTGVGSGSLTIGTGTGSSRGDVIVDATLMRPNSNGLMGLGSFTYQLNGIHARGVTLYDNGGSTAMGMSYSIVDQDSVTSFGFTGGTAGRTFSINGSGNAGAIKLRTLNMASGNSGDIIFKTGTSNATRGKVSVDALSLDMNSAKIVSVADPVSAQDASTKSYTDTQREAAKSYADAGVLVEKNRAEAAEQALDGRLDTVEALQIPKMEHYTKMLSVAGDLVSIDVGYAIVGQPMVMLEGILGRPGTEFTVSGSVITFSGEWLHPTGVSAVELGDVVHVYYMRHVSAF